MDSNTGYLSVIVQTPAMKVDFHSHSHYSFDAWSPIPELMKSAAKKGLGGIALTDHGTAAGWKAAKSYISEKKLPLFLIPSCEFDTEFGELIGFCLTEPIRARNFAELCDEIHSQGGFAVIPHPFDSLRGSACNPEKLPKGMLRFVDGIEVFNARCTLPSSNKKAAEFAKANKFTLQTAGSDSHFPFEVGAAWGEIPDGMEVEIALRKSLVSPMGRHSFAGVHGATTMLKLARKAGLLRPKI